MSLSTNENDLDTALNEAFRFISTVKALRIKRGTGQPSGKANAAAWRASLDLSDALSHMRRRK